MPGRFAGKVAIVTGAGGGIGAAVTLALANEGARVTLADLDAAAAEDVASRGIASAGAMVPWRCDVSDELQVEGCVAETLRRFGRLDIVINNAGLMTFKPMADWTSADWMKVLQVDLVGAALFTREMFRHAGHEGGAIVNVSSIHAVQTSPQAAPYAAAKAGLLSLTRTASIEGRARGIRANAVLPGAIDTPMLWGNPNIKSGAEVIDKQDVGSPENIAAAVAFLASDAAAFVTGASLVVDGGRLAAL